MKCVYSDNETLQSNEKQQTMVTLNNTDDPRRHNVEQQKPDTYTYTICDIYSMNPFIQNRQS